MKGTSQPPLSVTLARHIHEIPKEEWDQFFQNAMFCTHSWMELFEHSVREDVLPFYMTVTREGHLVGCGVCYVSCRRIWGVRVPVMVCGYSFSERMGLTVKEGEDYDTVLSLLYEGLLHVVREQGVWLIYVPYVEEKAADFFKQKGFFPADQMPLTYLDVHWKTFKEYLGSLSRKAKKNIRHTLNQGERKGLRLEHSHDFSGAEQLHRLYKANLEYHNYENLIPFTQELYKNLEKYVRDCSYILRCYHRNDLLGYWIYFFDGNVASMTISGIDRTFNREYDAYFNICYDAVREMIEKGCHRILFGMTTYRVKRRIGCSLKRTATAMKAVNPLLNVGLGLWVRMKKASIEKKYHEEE